MDRLLRRTWLVRQIAATDPIEPPKAVVRVLQGPRGSSAILDRIAKFLTESNFQCVTIRIPDQRPVADGRPRIFRLSSKALLLSRKPADAINFFTRTHPQCQGAPSEAEA